MFCRAMEIGLLGSRKAYALKEPYIWVYIWIKLNPEGYNSKAQNGYEPK